MISADGDGSAINVPGYDVIGDIHGHADKLTALLRTMGYSEQEGTWQHPSRQAIFVGDLIDRGPQQLETIDIVRRMVEGGHAQIVLGNHEFNAVAYATRKEDGGHLRKRNEKNNRQHAEFIAAVGLDSDLHREIIEWFMTLPLWLELGGLRVVHAYWSDSDIDVVSKYFDGANHLTEQLVVDASTEGHAAYESVERLLKGPEIELPNSMTFEDKGKHTRSQVRLTWWDDDATNWSDLLPPGTPIFDRARPAGRIAAGRADPDGATPPLRRRRAGRVRPLLVRSTARCHQSNGAVCRLQRCRRRTARCVPIRRQPVSTDRRQPGERLRPCVQVFRPQPGYQHEHHGDGLESSSGWR